MTPSPRLTALLPVLLISLLLVACGGGGTPSANTTNQAADPLTLEPGAPKFTGNTAVDGINWFNFRRQQMGAPTLQVNSAINQAAQAHSNYQKLSNQISHDQQIGKPGFTGINLLDRLAATGYRFVPSSSYAYGEVISATSDSSGFYMGNELITAIYHRFVIFEPMFKEAGSGAASVPGGYTYLTVDFTANDGYGAGIGRGNVISYPFPNQQRVPANFFSDYESPDPVPNQNEVGFPISVHADITANLTVQSFTIQARGGSSLPTRLLSYTNDAETPRSAAAIIPLSVLASNTTYDVYFIGNVDGLSVSRSWSFTTK